MAPAALAVPLVVMIMFAVSPLRAADVPAWRTPNGGLYFGDAPPRGSVMIRSYRDSGAEKEGSGETPGGSARDRLSVEASLERRRVERGLNDRAAELADVRRRIEALESTDLIGNDLARAAAAFVSEGDDAARDKQESVEDLHGAEREALSALHDLYAELDDLERRVVAAYGKPPSWWRPVACSRCPSRADVESALERGAE